MLRIREYLRHLCWVEWILSELHNCLARGSALAGFSSGFLLLLQLKDGSLKPLPINNHEWVTCQSFPSEILVILSGGEPLWGSAPPSPIPRAWFWSPGHMVSKSISLGHQTDYPLEPVYNPEQRLHATGQASGIWAYPQPWCSCHSLW